MNKIILSKMLHRSNNMISIIISVFIGLSVGQMTCHAPPGIIGDACISTDNFSSDDYTATVTYNIYPTSDTAQVMCQGLGYSASSSSHFSLSPKDQICNFGWYPIVHGEPILWGSNLGNPAIRCTAVSLETTVSWSWTRGVSVDGSCINPNKGNQLSEKQNIKITAITVTSVAVILIIAVFLVWHIFSVRRSSYAVL